MKISLCVCVCKRRKTIFEFFYLKVLKISFIYERESFIMRKEDQNKEVCDVEKGKK